MDTVNMQKGILDLNLKDMQMMVVKVLNIFCLAGRLRYNEFLSKREVNSPAST